jgi:ribose 5-phosphate isomerase B
VTVQRNGLVLAYPQKEALAMRVAVATDHAGFSLKDAVIDELGKLGVDALDLGQFDTTPSDFPDFAELVGRAIQRGDAERGILLCGSGVGVCIAANKLRGVRAALTHDTYSAHQGVEHDGMNVMCLGSRIIGEALARELVRAFVQAELQTEERFLRRIGKIDKLEAEG